MPKFNDFDLDLQTVNKYRESEMLPLSGGEGNWTCLPDGWGISPSNGSSGNTSVGSGNQAQICATL